MQDVTTRHDVWTYRDQSELGSNVMETHADLSGFSVEALDGSIGKVDAATFDVGQSFVVVDTGPWIFGKKVLLPAGVVRGIDETDERVYVNRTKDQIKHAPEYDEQLVKRRLVPHERRVVLRPRGQRLPRLGRLLLVGSTLRGPGPDHRSRLPELLRRVRRSENRLALDDPQSFAQREERPRERGGLCALLDVRPVDLLAHRARHLEDRAVVRVLLRDGEQLRHEDVVDRGDEQPLGADLDLGRAREVRRRRSRRRPGGRSGRRGDRRPTPSRASPRGGDLRGSPRRRAPRSALSTSRSRT